MISGQIFDAEKEYLSVTHSFPVNRKLITAKFGARKLETSLYRTVQKVFRFDI